MQKVHGGGPVTKMTQLCLHNNKEDGKLRGDGSRTSTAPQDPSVGLIVRLALIMLIHVECV